MKGSSKQLATSITQALLPPAKTTIHRPTWTPNLEQTLHHLIPRNSLTPTLISDVINPSLLPHPSLALAFFNWASQQPNFTHSSLSYTSLLKSLSFSRQFHVIQKILNQANSHQINLPPFIYRDVINSLITGCRTAGAYSIFNKNESIIYEIGSQTCNALLAALSSEKSLDNAREVFDKMIRKNIELNTLGFGVFILRYCKTVPLVDSLNLLNLVGRTEYLGVDGSIIAVLVVHGLCSGERLDEAVFVLEELRKRGFKADFMAYRVVAEALRERGRLDEVDSVLRRKRKLGVAPRGVEYGRFILSLINWKLIYEAKEIGEIIVSGNFPIEEDVLNTLVSSVSSVDPGSAVSFFNFMLGKRRFPTLPSLINLSENLIKHGKGSDLMDIIKHLAAEDYFKDAESYKEMIMFMCKMGCVQEAYQLLQEMKRKGINPDVEAYNIILEGCCREDKLRPARRLWDEMFANGYVVDRKSYCILISKFAEVGDVDEAYRLFCQMIGNGIVPDRTTYISVLEGFCKAKDLEKALLVFGVSVEQDLALSQQLLGEFIFFLCKEGYYLDASKLLRDCKIDSGQLDSHVKLLKLLGNAREVPLAMEHIKWIRQRSPQELHALHAALSASLHSSLELDQIIMFCELQKSVIFSDEVPDEVNCMFTVFISYSSPIVKPTNPSSILKKVQDEAAGSGESKLHKKYNASERLGTLASYVNNILVRH